MVERASISDEQFDEMSKRRGRWNDVIELLKTGDKVKVTVPPDEDNSQGRRKIYQQIYSAARFNGIRIRKAGEPGKGFFFIKASGAVGASI